jgi:hypothetical protein
MEKEKLNIGADKVVQNKTVIATRIIAKFSRSISFREIVLMKSKFTCHSNSSLILIAEDYWVAL